MKKQWLLEEKCQRVTQSRVRRIAASLKRSVRQHGGKNIRSIPMPPRGAADHSGFLLPSDKSKIRAISQYVVYDGRDGDYTMLRVDCIADHIGKIA